MEFAFPWPMSQGEWLAWSAAAATIAIGLVALLAPGLSLRLRALAPLGSGTDVAALRGPLAGFPLGLGLSCMLLAQPMIYIALGAAWLFAAVGRAVSLVLARGGTPAGWLWLALELALALLPLAYVFGIIA